MATATEQDKGIGHFKTGEHYRCSKCGMAIEVIADCRCKEKDERISVAAIRKWEWRRLRNVPVLVTLMGVRPTQRQCHSWD